MIRVMVVLACLGTTLLLVSDEKQSSRPSYGYEVAYEHEIKPHRRTISLKGVQAGHNQLSLKLIVSPTGDVVDAEASGDGESLKFWPELQGEVRQWKFTPFEEGEKAVTAEVEEYIDLVPPERLPKNHVTPPVIRPNSKIVMSLQRSGCFGSCPSYTVTISTEGIVFNGGGYVVASGEHRDTVDPDEVRAFAKSFVAADFYSMDPTYAANVTDNPSYAISIAIDGRTKKVEDYVGAWEGMPAVISELEEKVDAFARTERWIDGRDGLVEALQAEKFNFKTFQAQVMLKEAARHGDSKTLRELLEAGVPLEPLPAPKLKEPQMAVPFEFMGWLTAASRHPEALQVLLDAGASGGDQVDKDLALAGAAQSGNLGAVRTLIAYGANPNADLSEQTLAESGGSMTLRGKGAGSILIYAAESGNPDIVHEILRYRPKLEMRGQRGQTALFAVGDSRSSDKDGARVECIRLLVEAGADVNARDNHGNTPLHEIYLTDVEEELLKLGADVNARNEDGETPIFTTVDDAAIPLFIEYGANLSIRNNKGETVIEAAKDKGPVRREVLRKAIHESEQK